jgi:hypothetical protein
VKLADDHQQGLAERDHGVVLIHDRPQAVFGRA